MRTSWCIVAETTLLGANDSRAGGEKTKRFPNAVHLYSFFIDEKNERRGEERIKRKKKHCSLSLFKYT